MIKSWEETDMGRAEKAKKIHHYFELKLKRREQGLTEEEEIKLKTINSLLKG